MSKLIGRGFSVVAEEVQKLASLSGTSAFEINQIVEKSRNEAKNIIVKNETNIGKMLELNHDKIMSVKTLTIESSDILKNVEQNSQQLHQSVTDILNASSQQLNSFVGANRSVADNIEASQRNQILVTDIELDSEKLHSEQTSLEQAVRDVKDLL